MSAKKKPAVGYIRMSSDRQEDSPERQRMEIHKLAEREGYEVVNWYEDLGMTGTESAKREGFQKLMRDAEKRKFRVVLIHEQSRLSREHALDFMEHLNAFRRAGVTLITSLRGVVDYNNVAGLLMSMIDAHGARDESQKIAARTVSGKRAKYERKERAAGNSLFGYDREMIDETGTVIKRVHFRERFTKPPGWRQRLVVSADLEAVAAVRGAFSRVMNGELIQHIADDFNARGLRTILGNEFSHEAVKDILTNPVYHGALVAGRWSKGKFRRLDEDGIIWHDDAHPPIVSKALFDAVQEELKARYIEHRHCKPGRYLLGALVRCDHCGGRMYGRKEPKGRFYGATVAQHDEHLCPRPAFSADLLERAVMRVVRQYLLTPQNLARILRCMREAGTPLDYLPSATNQHLAAIDEKIARAESNLALAENEDDFRSVSRMMAKWTEQRQQLERELAREEQFLTEEKHAREMVRELSEHLERLETGDRHKLYRALAATIDRVVVGKRIVGQDASRREEAYGFVEFRKSIFQGRPIPLTDRELAPVTSRTYYLVADFLAKCGRAMTISELCTHFDSTCGAMSRHLAKAVDAGLLARLGKGRGWRSILPPM